eukprot:TRINITY_DN11189_c0_g1_i1.p1 TRINITY_DN11189_c0_g1~~TRINITY_DN11189_c0_g1_i1.p1  ORF type:complete len:392 (+),score=56.75 TRINITY_DN11189_c0_g1_i1:85-1260(+)
MLSRSLVHRDYRRLVRSMDTSSHPKKINELLKARENRTILDVMDELHSRGKKLTYSDISACILEAVSEKDEHKQLYQIFDNIDRYGVKLEQRHITSALHAVKDFSKACPFALRLIHYCHNEGILLPDSSILAGIRLCLFARDLKGLLAIPQREFLSPESMELSYGYSLELCRRLGDKQTAMRFFDEMILNKVPVSSRHYAAVTELFPKKYIDALRKGEIAAWMPEVAFGDSEYLHMIRTATTNRELLDTISQMHSNDVTFTPQVLIELIDKSLLLNDPQSARYWYNSLITTSIPPPQTLFSIMKYAVLNNDIHLAESIVDVVMSETCIPPRMFRDLISQIIALYERNDMSNDVMVAQDLIAPYKLQYTRIRNDSIGKQHMTVSSELMGHNI